MCRPGRSLQVREPEEAQNMCRISLYDDDRKAMNSTVHATSRATPTQLVFGRDTMLNASFQADWQFIKEHKQRLILQNNKRENAKRTPHTYKVGDAVVVKAGVKRKHGTHPYLGPMRITQVYDNGTVCQRASCATYGRDPCTLLHERLSTDSARSQTMQRH